MSADGPRPHDEPAGARRVVEADYEHRLAARRRARTVGERRHVWLSRARLALVGVVVALGVLIGASHLWAYLTAIAAFVAAAVVHSRVLSQRTRDRRAVAYYERGLERVRDRWIGRGDLGERYRPASHPYADDLDLFGRGSVFDLLGTPQTQPGRDTIAAWLLAPAPPDEVRARQAAVRELRGRPDLRESIATEGDAAAADRLSSLRSWAAGPRVLPAAVRPSLVLTSTILIALAAAIALAPGLSHWLPRALLLVAALQGAVVLWLHPRVHGVLHSLDVPASQLALLSGVLETLEHQRFEAPRLTRISEAIRGRGRVASVEIARLERLIALLESRQNILFALPASAVAWATQVACAIDAWRATVGPDVVAWIDAVGEFEALSAMATYAVERPDHVFPEFVAGPTVIGGTAIAHPLLPADAVGNDLAMGGGDPHVFVVSGSNMSGKSTWLRAIGTNVVLAQMGLPVRATTFRLTPMAVGASIRIVDSLQEGRSRFFAEIERLKLIVDLARARRGSALFLLDEILAGTNSHDRLRGAEGVVAGLVALGAIGLITTHDLALGDIAGRLPAAAVNVHFADEFDAGGLHFDYRLRRGVVQTRNAIALMRAVGLEIQP